MKTLRSISVACGLLLILTAASHAADLTVTVVGATNQKGQIAAALFNTSATFPGEPMVGQRVPAGAQVELVFKNLAPGRYALSAYHDENDNQKLDRGMFGIPKERYGFSRDARGAGGPPEFRDAAFEVKEGDNRVQLQLR
jgi:uncharacterized protein (DUF2141 family)